MSDIADLLKSLGLFGGIGFLIGLVVGIIAVVPVIAPTTRGGFAILVAIPAIVGAVVGGIISALLTRGKPPLAPPAPAGDKDGPMTKAAEIRSVVVEREFAHAPEKIWRALTEPHLIEEWLMKTDFKPAVGRKFILSGDWGAVDCAVRQIEPPRTLSYTWVAHGLESVVTWTLAPTSKGTHLRMEQSGFRPDQERFYQGAKAGWGTFFANLEQVMARLD